MEVAISYRGMPLHTLYRTTYRITGPSDSGRWSFGLRSNAVELNVDCKLVPRPKWMVQ